MKCPQCHLENRENNQFCEQCGAPLEKEFKSRCPECGRAIPDDARFCPGCGRQLDLTSSTGEAADSDLPPSPGERKPVTIFFADIVGSTQKAGVLDPEEWREVVSGAHERVSDAVTRYGGTIAQLLGDGVLAFFGAPSTHEDDPERGVRAALNLQESIQAYAGELAGYIDDFAMRIGIHAGTVVLGKLGSQEKSEYLAIGDAVNIASRLEGIAQPGQIVVSDQIARRVRRLVELDDLGPAALKGKDEPVHAFAVRGLRSVPSRVRGLETARNVFVGREAELHELRQALVNLCCGHGQIWFIQGEAGIGKSRLVDEVRRNPPGPSEDREPCLCSLEEIRWIEGRAPSYGVGLSFWLISQLLLSDLGLTDGTPSPRLRASLRKRIGALFGDQSEKIEPYLCRILGLKLKSHQADRLRELGSETLRHETFQSIESYFEAAAKETPVVLMLEDLHWADASSLEVLEQLLSITDRAPMMILGLMRIEDQHGSWDLKMHAQTNYRHRYRELQLAALYAQESRDLLSKVLGEGIEDSKVADLVLAKAEGNPLYLEELLRHLLERNLIALVNGTWHPTARLERVGIPDTLQGVLLARIDQLEEDVQRTLQLASVIGRSFLYRLLELISDANLELQSHLSRLQRADLVREKSRLPELEYMFKHAMTQEAAYNALLLDQRQQFHLKVAEAIETQFADRIEEYYGLLAHHYTSAGDRSKAIEFLTKAADQARLQDSLLEAKQLLSQLLELLEDTDQQELRARTWLKLALVHQTDFEFENAHQAYEEAFRLTKSMQEEQSGEARSKSFPGNEEFRIPVRDIYMALDLNDFTFLMSNYVRYCVLAGLVWIDAELNLVPHAARSWEVLEGGRRYVFHLRDDLFWSDGRQLKAGDFTAYWLWQLEHKRLESWSWLADVEGAEAFRRGDSDDPGQVGIHALSDTTIEIRLAEPLAHFLFLIAYHGFPAPSDLLAAHGEDWWRPPHGRYCGAFKITNVSSEEWVLSRNPFYFRQTGGNVATIRFLMTKRDHEDRDLYLSDQVDTCFGDPAKIKETPRQDEELHFSPPRLTTWVMLLNPQKFPTNMPSVRKALAQAVEKTGVPHPVEVGNPPADGGIVPPGLPGHSPELAFKMDLHPAGETIHEASRSSRKPIDHIVVASPDGLSPFLQSIIQPWTDELNLVVDSLPIRFGETYTPAEISPHLYWVGWGADYPDPHNFLVDLMMVHYSRLGWSDATLSSMIDLVRGAQDRKARLDLYRRIDRYLVHDAALVIPVLYGGRQAYYLKPWASGYVAYPTGPYDPTHVTISGRPE